MADGDLRSDEVKRLRDESDIIITNPPFSLFREFIAWIMYFRISCQPEERDEVMRLAGESGKSISRFVLDRIFGENRMIY